MIMKKLFIALYILFSYPVFSQTQIVFKYVVCFTDKINTNYSISNPQEFLTTRALSRRAKQNIPIIFNDLPVNYWYIDSVIKYGFTFLNKSKWLNSLTIQCSDTINIYKIRILPFVRDVIKVAHFETTKKTLIQDNFNRFNCNNIKSIVNNNSNYGTDSPLYDYGEAYEQIHMLGGDMMHSLGYKGEGMLIAVIDAGFLKVDELKGFESLWQNNQILSVKDFVQPWENVFTKSSHGMMVLSLIGGNLPGKYLGTAPRADFLLLRSEDASTENIVEEYNWIAAAEFADSCGADIINSSLGYTKFDDTNIVRSYNSMNGNTAIVTKGADLAASKGILVVNSAGNSGDEPWHYIGAPADADSILTIGAVNNKREYAYFSSVGPTYDARIKPNVCSLGEAAFVINSNGGVSSGNGTSFSSPIIAGMSACLWQANPQLTNMQMIEAIQNSGSQSENPDNYLGYGIPNFAIANNMIKGIVISSMEDEDVNIFPNPFSKNIYIAFYSRDIQDIKIELVNLNGSVVVEKNIFRYIGYNTIVLDNTYNLTEGIYLLRLISGEKVVVKKVIKKNP